MGFSSRLCSRISSPSRNTSVRKPSHLGSNCHPSPSGRASAALDNIGARGGAKGRRMAQYSRRCLVQKPFPGQGILELYRRGAEAAEQRRQPQPAHTVWQPCSMQWLEEQKNANEPPLRRLLSGKHNFNWLG